MESLYSWEWKSIRHLRYGHQGKEEIDSIRYSHKKKQRSNNTVLICEKKTNKNKTQKTNMLYIFLLIQAKRLLNIKECPQNNVGFNLIILRGR